MNEPNGSVHLTRIQKYNNKKPKKMKAQASEQQSAAVAAVVDAVGSDQTERQHVLLDAVASGC